MSLRDEEEATLPGEMDEKASKETMAPTDEPSSLRAWGVIVGVLLVNVITTGLVNTYGIMLSALESDPSSPYRNDSHFNLGFVAGCAVGLIFVIGPFGNILTARFGVRFPIGLGVFLMTFALMMASLADKFWQLLLSQGILYGVGASFAFVPAMGLPSQFFPHRRGLATGIAASGASSGAMVLSPIIEAVIRGASVQWAMRLLGFVCLGLGCAATVLCTSKTQRAANGEKLATQYKAMDWSILKVRGYAPYLLFAFLQMFGYALPVLTVPNYARSLGLSAQQGANLIIILQAGNFSGRLLGGVLGDKLGVINMLTVFTFMSGLLCVVFWQFATTFATVAAFAALWGVGAGAYWSLTVPATATIVGMERLGSAVSFNYMMNVIPPIFASSIGTAITDARARDLGISPPTSDPRSYLYLIVWAGLSYMVPALILLVVRVMLNPNLRLKL